MKQSEKRLLMILGIVLLVALPTIYNAFQGGTEDGDQDIQTADGIRISDLTVSQAEYPPLEVSELEAERIPFSGSRRNLFAYGAAVEPEREVEDPEDFEPVRNRPTPEELAAQREREQETRETQPKLVGYDYLGYHDQEEARTAVFLWRGQLFYGNKGTTVNKAFRILEIQEKTVRIRVLDGKFNQMLKLSQPKNRGNKQ